MQDIFIGIIGFGTVGRGVAKILLNDKHLLEQRLGRKIILKRIVDLDTKTDRGVPLNPGVLVSDVYSIIDDPEINIVVEVIGGENPARSFIEAALLKGKNVVTSNKEVIAKHGKYFTSLAKENNCTVLYEAAVGGGIPVLHAIRNSLSANTIEKVFGIVNGTTNFILSKMTSSGADFTATLKEAQALGYAEANPANDIEGFDAVYKLSILAGLAFRCHVDYSEIYREGITKITAEDIAAAKEFGYTIKILAIGINHHNAIELRVHPVMIEKNHPLATVSDAYNAIFIHGSSLGDSMLYGKGAGELPTASAVVGDIMNLAFSHSSSFNNDTDYVLNERTVLPIADCETRFFVRCVVDDASGVLAALATIFAKHSVSIERLQQIDSFQKSATLTIITHTVTESQMRLALHEIENLSCVRTVASVIRVGLE